MSIRAGNQVLSRTIPISTGETKTCLEYHLHQRWRLSIQETTGATSIRVTIRSGYANSQEVVEYHVNPGGGVDYGGAGPATIDCQAIQANGVIDIQVSDFWDSQFPLEFDESRQVIAPGAWTLLGGTGTGLGGTPGYARPFMNYVAIMTNANIDVRTITGANVIFQALNLAPHTLLLNQLKIGNHDAIEVQGTVVGQNVRAIWYNRT